MAYCINRRFTRGNVILSGFKRFQGNLASSGQNKGPELPYLEFSKQNSRKRPRLTPQEQQNADGLEERQASQSLLTNAKGSSETIQGSSNKNHILEEKSDMLDYLDGPNSDSLKDFSELPDNFGVNQHMKIDEDFKERLRGLLWKFRAPVRYSFAYGSGVFSQGKSAYTSGKKPQIDLIFGVNLTQHWHSLNMNQYPHHYSSLRHLGSGAVSWIQDNLGAGIYFNPYVEMDGMIIKYGVVNIDTIVRDLTDWDTIYLAGRLHKPTKILRDNPRVRMANQMNLLSVLRVALLLTPQDRLSLKDLFLAIAGVSYMGDPRMAVGENPNKVPNIVDNQSDYFLRLYSTLIDTIPNLQVTNPSSIESLDYANINLEQDMDPIKRGNIVSRLPYSFREKLYRRYGSKFGMEDIARGRLQQFAKDRHNGTLTTVSGGEFERKIAADPDVHSEVARIIRHTVAYPSTMQSLKGILTAGPARSAKYAAEKLRKKWASK